MLLAAGATLALAAASDLDPAFGTGGKTTLSIGGLGDQAEDLALQPDGKIVVAGSSNAPGNSDFGVARFNPDGSLDPTFSLDGKAQTPIGAGHDFANTVALQSDGKFVVAGETANGANFDFGIVRYNADGTLDASFDGDGIATTAIGLGNDSIVGEAIQADGKIVVAGYAAGFGGTNFALARFNPNGSLDATFDGDGRLTTVFGPGDDLIYDVALQPDGKIVVAGATDNGSDSDFAFARYNSDGSLDATFDSDGKSTASFGANSETARGVVLQPDGKIVAAGERFNGVDYDFCLTRLNPNGSLDAGFDGDGKVTTSIGVDGEYAHDVALQPNGKIVAAGKAYSGATGDFALIRYNSDGSLDNSFDGDGKLTTSFGVDNDSAHAVAIQPDGKIVAAGYSVGGATFDFALSRYIGDPPAAAPADAPTSTISSPARKKVRRQKLKAFRGTAGPAGQVAMVEISLRRIDKRLLKRKGRCLWLKNARGAFSKSKSKSGKCSEHRFLPASGTAEWSYKLKRRLRRGSYELRVRVTLTSGVRNETFSTAKGSLKRFRVY